MLAKFIGIVKQQLEYWNHQVAHFGPDHPRYRPAKIGKYEHLIKDFTELLVYLESQADQHPVDNAGPQDWVGRFREGFSSPKTRLATVSAAPAPARGPELAPDVPDDLADLPPELLNELSESIKGETDQLIKIINARGGTATLDEILIDLYRKYKEIGKRPIISNKLYRLSRRGLCWPIPGKKGIYTTTKPGGDDTSPPDDDDGADEETPEVSSNNSQPTTKSASSPVSSKARRDLFASTAIPRIPQ